MSDGAPPGPVVVPLPVNSLNDIPQLMETVAASMRAGQFGAPASAACVLVDENGSVTVFGWGRTDDVHSIGVLQLGAAWLSHHVVDR